MGFQRESRSRPLVEAGAETPVVVQDAKVLVQVQAAYAWSGFQRARRLFGRDAPANTVHSADDGSMPSSGNPIHKIGLRQPTAGGMQRGRAAGPLAKMARCHRAHLVSDTNDLFSLLSGFKIKEDLTNLNGQIQRREAQYISVLSVVGQTLVTVFYSGARRALKLASRLFAHDGFCRRNAASCSAM